MKDLFGNEIDEFVSAKERYGIWPITVWDCDNSNRDTQKLKDLIGDEGRVEVGVTSCRSTRMQSTRGESFSHVSPNSCYRTASSIFNPAIAAWILNLYGPKEGFCFDPFAGGGTRAIMAAKHGLSYIGCEIRHEEVIAVQYRLEACGVAGAVQIIEGDCRRSGIPDGLADFSFTCPPYYNLEQYDGGPDDLSMAPTYMHFCAGISAVFNECMRVLKSGSIAVWVVGLLRKDDGELIPLSHDIGRLGRAAGFKLKEEIVLAHRNNGAVQRVGNFEKGNKFLIRTHEYALVFERP